MRGDGIETAITRSRRPPARLLDLTRLVSRAGRHLTGIDRVEYAYARALTRQDVPCFGLVRSGFGVLLVRPELLWPVVQRICHGKRQAPDLLSRLARGKTRSQQEAETEMRRAAQGAGLLRSLPRLLARHLPVGFSYINVGHSNLDARVLAAVHDAGGRSAVMVHDVIPLEHPEFQRAGTVRRFAAKMQAVRAHADLILYNSADTQRRAEAALATFGPVPEGMAALLGVDPPTQGKPAATEVPAVPYFLALGTLEPRKNIGFLLDLWEKMGPDAPVLVLCGARGWRNEDVFARLDALHASGNTRVREVGGASDAARDALIGGARALLFPSLAEGFGLPAIEAAQQGIPVLCNTLPVFRETLRDIPIYASVQEPYLWINEIRALADTAPGRPRKEIETALTWAAHFKIVLSRV